MPRTRPITVLLVAATAATLVLVAGCSGGSSQDEVDWSPLPRVEYVAPSPVADRDLPAVQRTLATVDPCGLLDRVALTEVGVQGAQGTDLDPVSPSECDAGNGLLYVRLYEALPWSTRYSWARTQVGDHVAFTQARQRKGGCRVGLPVDFDHVVMVASLTLRCPDVLGAAAVVASRIAAADVVLRPAGVSRTTACGLAATALGVPLDSPRLVAAPDGTDGADLDDCTITSAPGAPVAPNVDVALELGPPVARLLAVAGYRQVTAGGQVVAETGGRPYCYLHADLPADPTTTSDRSVLGLQVNARSCRAGRAIVPRLLRAAADPSTTTGSLLPLANVLLRRSDPPAPVLGACEDVMPTTDSCVPLDAQADTEVPDDPIQLLRQGQADPAVTCAAAAGRVQMAYGQSMSRAVVVNPASGRQTCTFAGPDHVAQVDVAAVLDADPHSLEATVGGHPASLTESDSSQYAFRTWTIALTNADEPGRLVVSVTCAPEPGAVLTASYDPACVDGAQDLAAGLATDLLG